MFEDEDLNRSIDLTRDGYRALGASKYAKAQGSSVSITYKHGDKNRSLLQSPNTPYLFRVFSVINTLVQSGDTNCIEVAVAMLTFLNSVMANQLTLFKEEE